MWQHQDLSLVDVMSTKCALFSSQWWYVPVGGWRLIIMDSCQVCKYFNQLTLVLFINTLSSFFNVNHTSASGYRMILH